MCLIEPSEREDFEAVCVENGFLPDDFTVDEIEKSPRSRDLQPVEGYLRITHIPSGKFNSYRAGFGSSWVAQFAIDLKKGLFD